MDEQPLLDAIAAIVDEKFRMHTEEVIKPLAKRLEILESDIRSIKLTQENDIYPKITALHDGYSAQREISIETRKNLHCLEHKLEVLKDDFSVLKMRI